MSRKHLLLQGAFLLTAAGFSGRVIGFFYRIFLSRLIGAEGIGIYQLIFPFYALSCSLTTAGIHSSISRFVSAKTAEGDKRGALCLFHMGLFFSLGISFAVSFCLLRFHDLIALTFIHEKRCAPLLRLLAYSVPFAAIHTCIDGYYYGLKQTKIPAIGQILEQLLRLLSLLMLSFFFDAAGIPVTPSIAVLSLIVEEFGASLFSAAALTLYFSKQPPFGSAWHTRRFYAKELFSFSAPLTLNRVFVNLLQSIEAALIPFQLRLFGMDGAEALGLYGILTGMALPLILFPTAITYSVSVLLLPAVSEAQAKKDVSSIRRMIQKTCRYSLLLGFLAWAVFFFGGNLCGILLFKNKTAGAFIRTLSFVCPLMYLNPSLTAILNGLGKTKQVFLHNLCGILVRILFILFAIPLLGIRGYFIGLLCAQLLLTLLSLQVLAKSTAA